MPEFLRCGRIHLSRIEFGLWKIESDQEINFKLHFPGVLPGINNFGEKCSKRVRELFNF